MSKPKSKYIKIDRPSKIVCGGVTLQLAYRVIVHGIEDGQHVALDVNQLYTKHGDPTFRLDIVDHIIESAMADFYGMRDFIIEVQSRYVSPWCSEAIVK